MQARSASISIRQKCARSSRRDRPDLASRLQKKQELAWHEHIIKQKETQAINAEKEWKSHSYELTNRINHLTNELNCLEKNQKLQEKKLIELKNDLKEKTRQGRVMFCLKLIMYALIGFVE